MLQALTFWHETKDLYHWFDDMRVNQPVWLDETSHCWHVFRYEDVAWVLTDFAAFSAEEPSAPSSIHDSLQEIPGLATMDPPRHQRYRRLVASAFTSRAVASLAPTIHSLVEELLAPACPRGSMEIIAELASPLSVTVIATLLGLSEADHERCKRWADALFSQRASDDLLFGTQEIPVQDHSPQAQAALQEMEAFFQQVLAMRRCHSQHDLISRLLASSVDGEYLSEAEIISLCVLLFLAGQVTTTHLLGQSLLCLDAFPEALRQCRADPACLPAMIEEVLRFAPPAWRVLRYTRGELDLAGIRLPAHAPVFAWLASANRDPGAFVHPDRFDLARVPNPHLSFGQGVHFCLGAPLARLVISVALPLILARLPDLQIVHNPPLELLGSHLVFGVQRLPVTFTPTSG